VSASIHPAAAVLYSRMNPELTLPNPLLLFDGLLMYTPVD
jgi:hypothetical protein